MACVPVEVQDPRYSHPGLTKQDALCAAVPPQSSHTNRYCRVSSREFTTALARPVYGAGQSSGVCAHRNTTRRACKGVWHQRDPPSQFSRVPEVSPVISVRLLAPNINELPSNI